MWCATVDGGFHPNLTPPGHSRPHCHSRRRRSWRPTGVAHCHPLRRRPTGVARWPARPRNIGAGFTVTPSGGRWRSVLSPPPAAADWRSAMDVVLGISAQASRSPPPAAGLASAACACACAISAAMARSPVLADDPRLGRPFPNDLVVLYNANGLTHTKEAHTQDNKIIWAEFIARPVTL